MRCICYNLLNMRGWVKEQAANKPSKPMDYDQDDSYFNEGEQHSKTSAINFARSSNILGTSKYGLPMIA